MFRYWHILRILQEFLFLMTKNTYLIFVKSKSIKGWLIRLVTGEDIDHVAIYSPRTKTVYEMVDGGLEGVLMVGYRPTIIGQVELLCWDVVSDWLVTNSKVKYDWGRTILWPFRKLFTADDPFKLNCVEMGESLPKAHRYEPETEQNRSPGKLYKSLTNGHWKIT